MADINKYKAKLDILSDYGNGIMTKQAAVEAYQKVCAETLGVETYTMGEVEKIIFEKELDNILKTIEYHNDMDDSYDDFYESDSY